MRRKYLHIEISNGGLYVYSDDEKYKDHTIICLADLDNECNLTQQFNKTRFSLVVDSLIEKKDLCPRATCVRPQI